VKQYSVTVTDEDATESIELQRYRKGERFPAETVTASEVFEVSGQFMEVDAEGKPVPDGLSVKLDFITLYYKHFQAKLTGKQREAVIDTTFGEFFERDLTALNILKISSETYEVIKDKSLHFRVNNIQHVVPKELSEAFYQEILGEQTAITDPDAFFAEYKQRLQNAYDQQAEERYRLDLQRNLLMHVEFDIPIEHVQRMLVDQFEDVNTIEELWQKHPNHLADFKLFVLHEKLKEMHPELRVTDQDIEGNIKEGVAGWFQQQKAQTEALAQEATAELEGTLEETTEPIQAETPTDAETASAEPAEPAEPDAADETAEASADVAAQAPNDDAIEGLVQHLMTDKSYVERTTNELQARRILDFLEARTTTEPETVSKQTFDDLA